MSTVQVRADIFEIIKNGGDCELVLKNASRGTPGWVLTNVGDGVTEFAPPTGGAAARFGVATEDEAAGEDRNFELGDTFHLTLNSDIVAGPYGSGMLQLNSTNRGFLEPRMTEAQRDAIATPAEGLQIYNTDSHLMDFFDGTTWQELAASSPIHFAITGEDDTAAENRNFSLDSLYSFTINNATQLAFMSNFDSLSYSTLDLGSSAGVGFFNINVSNDSFYYVWQFPGGYAQADFIARGSGDFVNSVLNEHGIVYSSNISITPDASALLQLNSTVRGFLQPVMTTTQRNAIATPAEGLEVYDVTLHVPYYYDGTTWVAFGTGGGSGRFGVTGEDDTASANRSFDAASFSFVLDNASILNLYAKTSVSQYSGINFNNDGSWNFNANASASVFMYQYYDPTSSGDWYSAIADTGTTENSYLDMQPASIHLQNSGPTVFSYLRIEDDLITLQAAGAIKITGDPILIGQNNAQIIITGWNAASTPDASAILTVENGNIALGFLPPHGSTTLRNAIPTPTEGLHFYDDTLHVPYYFDGTTWVAFGTGGGGTVHFGVSGEDDSASADRDFDLNTHEFKISSTSTGSVINFDVAAAAGNDNIQFKMVAAGNVGFWKAKNNAGSQFGVIAIDKTEVGFGQTEGAYSFTNVPSYADNTAATGAGLTAGKIYRSGDSLNIVH